MPSLGMITCPSDERGYVIVYKVNVTSHQSTFAGVVAGVWSIVCSVCGSPGAANITSNRYHWPHVYV